MLTQEEDVEASALKKRGWSIAAIARHLGRDRKTIRAYLSGERRPSERRPAVADNFAPFEPYVTERLREDPHLWATALHDELIALGWTVNRAFSNSCASGITTPCATIARSAPNGPPRIGMNR